MEIAMSNKPTPPENVIRWRRCISEPAPRCCWTCDHFHGDGMRCGVFDASVPSEYADSINTCADYLDEIPF